MKKIIVFDMDGTLAESKQKISKEMAHVFSQLLNKYNVAIISWWDYPQFKKQVLPFISWELKKLLILPTSGTKMYKYKNDNWAQEYCEDLDHSIKKKLIKKIEWWIDTLNYTPIQSWWELIEDRGTQVTYSALWQEAPVCEKEAWDPSGKKRKAIQQLISPYFPELQINTWGSTSIDITKKWIDKWYGINKIISLLKIQKKDILFIWDAIYPGGNDYPPKQMWIDCIKVSGPSDTKKHILDLLQ